MLDHSSIFIREFLSSPFSMLIHTILDTGTDGAVERNFKQRGGKEKLYFETRVWDYDSILQWGKKLNSSAVNGAMELNKERRSDNFWP